MTTNLVTQNFMSMKSGGYYSKATLGAKHVIDNAEHLIIDAIKQMDLIDDGNIFTMADMGCADGGTSIAMVGRVLREIRKRIPSSPIQIVYTDLPKNDFSEVFQNIHGQTDLKTYINDIENLYVFCSATSFHEPIFPPNSLNLGFSATASHYLSEKPCMISNHVHMVGAKGKERAAYIEQGRHDWESMLLNRAKDLVPNGRLALFNFGIDENGYYLGATGGISMFDTFNQLWSDLLAKGVITNDEYRGTNFPQSYRTVEQFTAPLKDIDNPVYKAGLRIDHVETRVVNCPFASDFKKHNDSKRFAEEYIPTLRSWSEATFLNGLSSQRSNKEKQQIVDTFYNNYQQLVEDTPQGHGMDYVHCYLIIRKEL